MEPTYTVTVRHQTRVLNPDGTSNLYQIGNTIPGLTAAEALTWRETGHDVEEVTVKSAPQSKTGAPSTGTSTTTAGQTPAQPTAAPGTAASGTATSGTTTSSGTQDSATTGSDTK